MNISLLCKAAIALIIGLSLLTSQSARTTYPGRNGKIAFIRFGITIMNADMSEQEQIPNTEGAGEAAWSPDGNKIAFQRWQHADMDDGIYLVNIDGEGHRKLTRGSRHLRYHCCTTPAGEDLCGDRLGPRYRCIFR